MIKRFKFRIITRVQGRGIIDDFMEWFEADNVGIAYNDARAKYPAAQIFAVHNRARTCAIYRSRASRKSTE